MGENIYMLPSDPNVKIKTGTVGYNNKILVSDGKFRLGKNDKVNALEPVLKQTFIPKAAINSHKTIAQSVNCYSRFTTGFTTMYRLSTKTNYHSLRRKSCINTFSNCSLYNMVYVSLNTSLQNLNTSVYINPTFHIEFVSLWVHSSRLYMGISIPENESLLPKSIIIFTQKYHRIVKR